MHPEFYLVLYRLTRPLIAGVMVWLTLSLVRACAIGLGLSDHFSGSPTESIPTAVIAIACALDIALSFREQSVETGVGSNWKRRIALAGFFTLVILGTTVVALVSLSFDPFYGIRDFSLDALPQHFELSNLRDDMTSDLWFEILAIHALPTATIVILARSLQARLAWVAPPLIVTVYYGCLYPVLRPWPGTFDLVTISNTDTSAAVCLIGFQLASIPVLLALVDAAVRLLDTFAVAETDAQHAALDTPDLRPRVGLIRAATVAVLALPVLLIAGLGIPRSGLVCILIGLELLIPRPPGLTRASRAFSRAFLMVIPAAILTGPLMRLDQHLEGVTGSYWQPKTPLVAGFFTPHAIDILGLCTAVALAREELEHAVRRVSWTHALIATTTATTLGLVARVISGVPEAAELIGPDPYEIPLALLTLGPVGGFTIGLVCIGAFNVERVLERFGQAETKSDPSSDSDDSPPDGVRPTHPDSDGIAPES